MADGDPFPHSFGSVPFWAATTRSVRATQQVAVLKIPAGDITYIDDGGQESPTWTGEVLLENFGWFWTLRNTRGDQALVTHEGTYRGVLTEVESLEYWRDGEPRRVRCTFQLTQWPG